MKEMKKRTILGTILLTLFMLIILPANVSAAETNSYLNIYVSGYTFTVGETYDIGFYASGEKEYSISDFNFTSSDKTIATVSKEGKVKTLRSGDVTITATCKTDKNLTNNTTIHIYQGYLTIKGDKKYEAGKTYQLKSDKKDVIWSMYNIDYNTAAINSKTGKLKIKRAGQIYVYARTKDGKYYGSTYIDSTGPIITNCNVSFDPIIIKEDMGINDFCLLQESGLLPTSVKLNYTYGKKKGKVKCDVIWDEPWSAEYSKPGTYSLRCSINAPDGYAMEDIDVDKLTIDIKTTQTDNRIRIVKFEDTKVTLSKDYHVVDSFEIITNYFNILDKKIIGITESGEKIEFNVNGTSISGDFSRFSQKGVYTQVDLIPKDVAGYVIDEGVKAKLTVTVKKKQTYSNQDDTKLTLDDIPVMSFVMLPATQEGVK